MKQLFICHAGSRAAEADEHEDLGIVGMAYVWEGEWLRSPESTEGRERNPVMKLRPLFGPHQDVWGDVGCFTAANEALRADEETSPTPA